MTHSRPWHGLTMVKALFLVPSIHMIGCNNVIWVVNLCHKFFCFSCFSPYMSGILETRNMTTELGLPIKPCMHICSCSWTDRISKKTWILTYFGPVAVDSVEVFRHFACWRHGTRLATFLLHLRIEFFEAHLLSPLNIWQLWFPESFKVFMESPYTIVTPYHMTW